MSPDSWIAYYYRMKDSFGAPAMDLVDSTGRVYEERCAGCGGSVKHGTKRGVIVCGHCGEPWPYVDRHVLKGHYSRTRRANGFDVKHAGYFDVARLLHRFLADERWYWPARMYVASVNGFTVRTLAREFAATFPEYTGPSSRSAIGDRIGWAREEWARRLEAAGLEGGR